MYGSYFYLFLNDISEDNATTKPPIIFPKVTGTSLVTKNPNQVRLSLAIPYSAFAKIPAGM